MKIESGKFYKCGLGDIHGPMHERTAGVWLDQHGALYHDNGFQWSHAPDSKGNLVGEHAQIEARESPADAFNDAVTYGTGLWVPANKHI